MYLKKTPLTRAVASSILAVALSACSSSDDDSTDLDGEDTASGAIATCEAANTAETADATVAPYFAFASTRAADFSSGFYERLSVGDSIELSGCSASIDSSDNAADTDGSDFYGIGRFNQDNITRYDIESFEADYQYSVVGGDGVSSNPYDIAFVSDSKAYVARYGTGEVWVINPSATSLEEFFISEIDLSAYDADGATEMSQVVVVDDKLFVLMQRLQNFDASLNGYIAVVDTNTDTEIATGQGSDGLNGIELSMSNGMTMFFNDTTNDLVVSSTGDPFGSGDFSGGVMLVDTTDYTSEVLIDDDTLGEYVSKAIIASPEKGYILSFDIADAFGVNSLRTFNPTTGVVDMDPIETFNTLDISSLDIGPDGYVWAGIVDTVAPGFERINPEDDSVVGERIRTELIPVSVVFIER